MDQMNDDKDRLYVPSKRDDYYQGNVARYLLDLDEEGATFDFCGGELKLYGRAGWLLLFSWILV